jgi:hypothetical protein
VLFELSPEAQLYRVLIEVPLLRVFATIPKMGVAKSAGKKNAAD